MRWRVSHAVTSDMGYICCSEGKCGSWTQVKLQYIQKVVYFRHQQHGAGMSRPKKKTGKYRLTVTQRKRAGLITRRTLDRNQVLLPSPNIFFLHSKVVCRYLLHCRRCSFMLKGRSQSSQGLIMQVAGDGRKEAVQIVGMCGYGHHLTPFSIGRPGHVFLPRSFLLKMRDCPYRYT